MSVEERLRAGLRADATSLSPAPVERELETVHRRVRRRERARWAGRVAVAGAVAAAVVAIAVITGDRIGGSSVDPVERPPTTIADLAGEYVVDVPATVQGDHLGISGRWVVVVDESGVMELTPPPGGADGASDATLRVEGDRIVTNALHAVPGCQAGEGVGTYAWSADGDTVDFSVVEEDCRGRTLLFTATSWRRLS